MSRACSVNGCLSPHIARGYCQNHYRVFMRNGTPTPTVPSDQERLMSRVSKNSDGCWIFTGCKNTYGYGTMDFNGRQDVTHRVSWTLFQGPIPQGLWVLHKCDVRACVNPDHLFLGDATDNNRDMAEKGRHARLRKTHCPHGHPYSGSNLIFNKRGRTYFRACRACKQQSHRRSA